MMMEAEKDTRRVLVCTKLDEFVAKRVLFIAHVVTYADGHNRITKVEIYNNNTDVLLRI